MGYYSNQILFYTNEDTELDRRDGPLVLTPARRRLDPMIALARPYRTAEYSIYYSAGDPQLWSKCHGGSFATYEAALRTLKRLGWQPGNGVFHCIIPAVAETLSYPIGLELLYGRLA